MTNFKESAMLASVNIRTYGAKKEDKKATKKTTSDNGATDDAGKFQKNLVSKADFEAITKAVGELRTFHYDNTLPWLDEGIRILPAMNYETYKTEMESRKDKFDSAVAAFVRQWPTIIAAAQKQLGAMFDPADYPANIADKFGVTLRFMPVADAADFRVEVSDAEREQLIADARETIGAAVTDATRDLYRRLLETTQAMAARLAAYRKDEATGKSVGVFRDSLVENLREVVALIPRLNFAGDESLADMAREIERELLQHTAQDLRDSDLTRGKVAASAEDIAARLGEFMK